MNCHEEYFASEDTRGSQFKDAVAPTDLYPQHVSDLLFRDLMEAICLLEFARTNIPNLEHNSNPNDVR